MRTILMLTMAAVVAAGCAMKQWRHETKTAAEFERDRKECVYEARKAAPSVGNPVFYMSDRNDIERTCLELRGYVLR